MAMVLYPLLDLVYSHFITHSEFVYSIYDYIFMPIIFGISCGTVYWIMDKKKK